MLGRIFRPLTSPAVALLAVILVALGGTALTRTRTIAFDPARIAVGVAGACMLAAAAYLVICFIRGVKLDLSVAREGMVATARITRIENAPTKHGREWLVHFVFTDITGASRENHFTEDDDGGGSKWRIGQHREIRYHRDEPSIYRLVD